MELNSALWVIYMAKEKAELSQIGYKALGGIADPQIFREEMQKAVLKVDGFPDVKVKDLIDLVSYEFHGKHKAQGGIGAKNLESDIPFSCRNCGAVRR